MTVAPVASATAVALLAEASDQQAQRAAVRAEAEAAVLAVFAALSVKNAYSDWVGGIGERIYVLVSILQELIAREAIQYVRRMLGIQGLVPTGPTPNPENHVGIASDMRDLESLLAGAIVHIRQAQRAGEPEARQRERAENYLRLVISTQAGDAGRASESVAMVAAEPVKPERPDKVVDVGWVRMLNPPSCSRCAVLAGRFYRWSSGFERHEMCDCVHIPVTVAGSNELITDPKAYFDSLTEPEQDALFTKAVAQAIRDGADVNQAVNAATRPGAMFTADRGRRYTRDGITRRGRARGVLRPTPWQIYADADGDRDLAISLLRRFGYIVQ